MAVGLPFALTVGSLAFLLGVIWGGPFVEILRRLRIGKQIRIELPEGQQKKVGTPTMGGVLIVLPVVLVTLGLNIAKVIRAVTGPSILLPLFVLVTFSLLGMIDDWEGIQTSRGRRGEGLSGRVKFAAQVVLATIVAVIISRYASFANQISIPLIPFPIAISPLIFIPITVFYIVGMSNALNFTDGLDGLAGIISASAFAAYGVIAYLQGQIFLVQLCFIIVGACFAFL